MNVESSYDIFATFHDVSLGLLPNAFFRRRNPEIDGGWGFTPDPPEQLTTYDKEKINKSINNLICQM